MKKNLALVLALVMVVTSLLSLVPMAEASGSDVAEKYTPAITYSNVNYTDKMYMMFAVPSTALPAPVVTPVDTTKTDSKTGVTTATKGEATAVESVVLLLWATKEDGEAFTYNDLNKVVLTPEAETVKINGVDHFVFKYDALDASQMTNVICARPIHLKTTTTVTKTTTTTPPAEGATEPTVETKDETKVDNSVLSYGALIEYSVLEYVVSAKGGFDGIAPLAADKLAALNQMLAFGALVQKFNEKAPAEYYPDSELAKMYVTPVFSGVVSDYNVFAGFKNAAEGTITLSAPHIDGKEFQGFTAADGSALVDLDGIVSNGIQINAPAGDLVVRANYSPLVMVSADPARATSVYGGIDTLIKASGNSFSLGIGDLTLSLGAAKDNYGYAGLWHIDDPYNEGEYVYRMTSSTQSNIYLGETANDWKASMKPTAVPGFGEIIDSCAVIDISVGRYGEKFVRTGDIRLRSELSGSPRLSIGYFESDGTFMLYNGVQEDGTTPATTALDVKVAQTGYTRYVFVVDFEAETVTAYAAADADGELVLQMQTSAPKIDAALAAKGAWVNWIGNLGRVEFWCASQSLSEEEMELKADLDKDGVPESAMVVDGVANKEAVKAVQIQLHSFLIKSYSTYVGNPFK